MPKLNRESIPFSCLKLVLNQTHARVFDTVTADKITTVGTDESYTQPIFTEDELLVIRGNMRLVIFNRSSLEISAHYPSVSNVNS